jgi:hypothetical protein
MRESAQAHGFIYLIIRLFLFMAYQDDNLQIAHRPYSQSDAASRLRKRKEQGFRAALQANQDFLDMLTSQQLTSKRNKQKKGKA